MVEAIRSHWTIEEFVRWQEAQSQRFELVGGQPKAMTGATNVHDDIVVNILIEIGNQTRGGPCRPFTADGSVETYPGQIRRPDVGLDCGKRDPRSTLSAEPRLVVEVLSPSTRDVDTFEKLDEYQSVRSIAAILFIEPTRPQIVVWQRTADGSWMRRQVEGLAGVVELPDVGVVLNLAAVYDGVTFPLQPRLVADG